VDAPYDDFERQPLLPNKLSQLGPGVSWADVDRDGDEDLLITSGRGGWLALHRNDGGRSWSQVSLLEAARFDQASVLVLPHATGSPSVLVGQSIYEARTLAEAQVAPAVREVRLNGGRPTVRTAVPGDNSSVGPLALADVDADGDLDLFVGGRVVPTAYPFAPSSRLFRNVSGQFELDGSNTQRLARVGMVSSALFSDLDGDGDPDLLLALEWGPLKLFRNEDGKFAEAGSAVGLGELRSRWNGLATGDFDGDGRLDIIATSWGRNTRYRMTAERPLLLYYSDFDQNGSLDLLHGRAGADGRIYPLDSRARLRSGIPYTLLRIPSAEQYARATLRAVVGPELEGARTKAATSFDHVLLLNRGPEFELVTLAAEAQLAPAYYAGVADFDGDGHEDVFLSQNFFPTAEETAPYAAGRGLWLRGNGAGLLDPVPGHLSGILVYGDQRGAGLSDFNADGRVDLVVTQNGSQTKLFSNDRAEPGLRVRLVGQPANPDAVGAVMRIVYADRLGPAREIQAGSGYWSQNGAVQVMGLAAKPLAVWVRWPGGIETETSVPEGVREIEISMNGSGDR
jgi:hypothetical protein